MVKWSWFSAQIGYKWMNLMVQIISGHTQITILLLICPPKKSS